MNALELTQRQRKLLGNIVKAAGQYRQAVADASARLERENEQIEQSRAQERQRIEEERKQKRTQKIIMREKAFGDSETLLWDEEKEKKRDEFRQRVRREILAKSSTIPPRRDITTIETVKREINRVEVSRTEINIVVWGFVLLSVGTCCGLSLLIAEEGNLWMWGIVVLGAVFFLWRLWDRRTQGEGAPAFAKRLLLLDRLYDRWLELVDEQADAQRAEARRRYDQAFAQAKDQMLAAVKQSRPAIAEFGTLAEQASPSWQSEAWRQWEPGRVGPGAVRLGTFNKVEV